jgi:hypothetical protein
MKRDVVTAWQMFKIVMTGVFSWAVFMIALTGLRTLLDSITLAMGVTALADFWVYVGLAGLTGGFLIIAGKKGWLHTLKNALS